MRLAPDGEHLEPDPAEQAAVAEISNFETKARALGE